MNSWLQALSSLSPGARRVLAGIAAATLIAIFAVEATRAAHDLSATWDEPYHIVAGYRYWRVADYGVNPEHPPLAKLLGTFPLLFMHLKAPRMGVDDSKPTANIQGRWFVYRNNADALLLRARLAEALVGLLLVGLIFEAAYRMFGAGTAWIAALLAVFEPNLLAHCALVTTDFSGACFGFAAVYGLWRTAEKPSLRNLLGCGAMTGLALASKHSEIIVIPVLAILVAVEVAARASGARRAGSPPRNVFTSQVLPWAGRLTVIWGVAWVVLWGFYGFRYHARPYNLPLWEPLSTYASALKGHLAPYLIRTAGHYRLLPEAYLFGLTDVILVTGGPRVSFLLGTLYPHALWYYFPVAFIIKSTLGFLVLLLLALATLKLWWGEGYRKAIYLLVPPTIFMGVALTAGTNMGIRHVLPIYPFLIVVAAAGAWKLVERRQAWPLVVAALLAFHIGSSLHTLPDYLAYSNELFGGTSQTYKTLSDSNVDWGQGLREAAQYVTQRHIKDCWIAYFGTADPNYYHLPCKLLPDPFLRWWNYPFQVPPEVYHGVVLISGTEIAAPYWGAPVLNPYNDFQTAKPTEIIGGSILVFEGDVDLHRASAVARMYKAWDDIADKKQETAIQEALKAAEIYPNHPAAPFIIGYVLAKAKRPEAARIQFEECLRIANEDHPEFSNIWVAAAKAQLAILPKQ